MTSTMGRYLIWIGLVLAGLLMAKLMFDMNANMARMTGYVGTLSQDVAAMRTHMEQMSEDMTKMRESMQHMDANIQSMGGAVKQGGKMFQQWNPTEMMR